MSLDELRERVRRSRVAQGLPEHVENPAVLASVAAIIGERRKRPVRADR